MHTLFLALAINKACTFSFKLVRDGVERYFYCNWLMPLIFLLDNKEALEANGVLLWCVGQNCHLLMR